MRSGAPPYENGRFPNCGAFPRRGRPQVMSRRQEMEDSSGWASIGASFVSRFLAVGA